MTHRTFALIAILTGLTACDVERELQENEQLSAAGDVTAAACTRCHGSGDDPAPPNSVRGDTSTSSLAVGAHQAHLRDGLLHRAFACSECHAVPTDRSHVDGVARLRFGPLATASDVAATWDRDAATCATYCHGATLGGGANPSPRWTGGAPEAACGSCHGLPPPAPHPALTNCGACHPGATRTAVDPGIHVNGRVDFSVEAATQACGTCHGLPPSAPHPQSSSCGRCHDGYSPASVNPALHLNGAVDRLPLDCSSCHGDASRTTGPAAAPPADTSGNLATTFRGVGAHQAHLGRGALGAPVECAECHAVPTAIPHANGVAELTFGGRAAAGGAAPAWNAESATCTTYCHGATLPGGTAKQPVWTKVDGSQKSCGSCHGAPPPPPHAQNTNCGSCHGAGYDLAAATVNPATHLDGTVQQPSMTCTSCHGDATRVGAANAAPPFDTRGNAATTARGVGAHQAHLGAKLAAPLACTECHVVPTAIPHADGAAQVTFGSRARAGGVSPSFDGTALTCATYCHGATLSGGSARTPAWTRVDGSQKSCSSCHGAPPDTGEHDKHGGRSCGDCHGTGYSRTGVNVQLHANGVKNVGNRITSYDRSSLTCTNTCHESEEWR